MTKNQKIEFINKIYSFFADARNHGHNGNNWWYPKANTIAYNVKMRAWFDVEDARKAMTKRQNEYYTDDGLYQNFEYSVMEMSRECLRDDVKAMDGVRDCGFAGRSGGWFEVEFFNGIDSVDNDTPNDDITLYYSEAKKMEKQEEAVKQLVTERHAGLKKYIDGKDCVKEFVESLLDDEAIGGIYKSQAEAIIKKLN